MRELESEPERELADDERMLGRECSDLLVSPVNSEEEEDGGKKDFEECLAAEFTSKQIKKRRKA